MTDLGLIIFAIIFGFIFFGPHNKSKVKKEDRDDDRRGDDKGGKR